jgi:glucose-1-phosphate thymidylyltransferase
MKSLLLASGFGTRLHPLNVNKAKALIDYKGKPLISHLVNKIPQDIPILVNTNKKFESAFRLWQKTLDRNTTIYAEPVLNEKQAFGAIGSIEYCIKTQNIAEDLLVIASDNYFEFDLGRFIASYNGKNTLVAVHDIGDKSKASHYGVVKLGGSKIVELEEKPAQPKYSLIAIACYIFPQRIFPLLTKYCSEGKRDNLGGFIAYLIANDEVHAYVFNELWLDIGSTETYKSVQRNKS